MNIGVKEAIRVGEKYSLDIDSRYFISTATKVMRGDVLRALVELITNADDSYWRLERRGVPADGKIEVCICRRRKSRISTIAVKDLAEGMDLDDTAVKLKRVGSITSGFVESGGAGVRGMMGRGGKECVIFGAMTYESIKDGWFTRVRLEQPTVFKPLEYRRATRIDRVHLGIPRGNGTIVTLEVQPKFTIPTHDFLKSKLPRYYSLRGIAATSDRRLLLLDEGVHRKKPAHLVYAPRICPVVLDGILEVRGFRDARAHLTLMKSSERVEFEKSPYWEGGILVRSDRAIHGITLFNRDIENNPYAGHYFGTLDCPFINTLALEYEQRERSRESHPLNNPSNVIDPFRDEGLVPDHPFTKALYTECGRRLKDLLKLDEESDSQRKRQIENQHTTARLKRLAVEMSRFIRERTADLEPADENYLDLSEIKEGGLRIIPGSANIPLGGERRFYVYMRPLDRNKLGGGPSISADSEDIALVVGSKSPRFREDGICYTLFTARGLRLTDHALVKVAWGAVAQSVSVQVVRDIVDGAENQIHDFSFEKSSYTVREGKYKGLRILASWPDFVRGPVQLTLNCHNDGRAVEIVNPHPWIKHDSRLSAGVATVRIFAKQVGTTTVSTRLQGKEISARVHVLPRKEFGSDMEIKVVDEDLGDQRAVWDGNRLKINGRHASIGRYLGSADTDYAGQDSIHFRLLLAELVAENVARRVLETSASTNISAYENFDVSAYYRLHLKHMNDFLVTAHKKLIPESDLDLLETVK